MADPERTDRPTIMVTFDAAGNMALAATPDITIDMYTVAAWLLNRQANMIADSNPTKPLARPTLVPS